MKKLLLIALFLISLGFIFNMIGAEETYAKENRCKPGQYCVPSMPTPIPVDPLQII